MADTSTAEAAATTAHPVESRVEIEADTMVSDAPATSDKPEGDNDAGEGQLDHGKHLLHDLRRSL